MLTKCKANTWAGDVSPSSWPRVTELDLDPGLSASSLCFFHCGTAHPGGDGPLVAARSFQRSEALWWDFRPHRADEGGTTSPASSPGGQLPVPCL